MNISSVGGFAAGGCGVFINIDVLDINKGCNVNHLLTRKDLVAGKLHVPFVVRCQQLLIANYIDVAFALFVKIFVSGIFIGNQNVTLVALHYCTLL